MGEKTFENTICKEIYFSIIILKYIWHDVKIFLLYIYEYNILNIFLH